jgi:hypothetical protein
MERNNFFGLDKFIWWVGVIENRIDPLAVGRCQVRIFGWHTENISLLPTTQLPWALPVYPLNNSKSFSAPRLGDWVVGFFMDGESAQMPIMLGVMPNIVTVDPTPTPSTYYNPIPEVPATPNTD